MRRDRVRLRLNNPLGRLNVISHVTHRPRSSGAAVFDKPLAILEILMTVKKSKAKLTIYFIVEEEVCDDRTDSILATDAFRGFCCTVNDGKALNIVGSYSVT